MPLGQVRGVALHYSAANSDEVSAHANCAARVRAIQAFHMDNRGWADIAYNFLVCKHGVVFEGRGRSIRSAAQGSNEGNEHYHAVCFLGDDTKGRDDVTVTGRRALAQLVLWLWAMHPTGLQLRPHSDFHATACPGDELRRFIKRLHAAVFTG